MDTFTPLGPYVAGEVPEPWVHSFDDFDGVSLDLTGFTAQVSYRVDDSAQTVRTATIVDAAAGDVGVSWVTADFATAGLMHGELTVSDSTNRYARTFECVILSPRGGTLPAP